MQETLSIYGIKNCNTMKKAFDFLESKGVPFVFIDYKKIPPSKEFLKEVLKDVSIDILLNKKGTTYKTLDSKPSTQEEILEFLCQKPSAIKRPLVKYQGRFYIESLENILQGP
ncbi:hypothetical protein BKH43_07435 [Helicobacter sp. 13S00401-1]|uniref:Spx/MgsR family RNA polymerase-binding regulatory protein n=1 Tax=Helicobacter sp. 13S00401-1 TaxID=1905758 RepID=UPI000BA62828|nr:Spx/MgsR family RNA polymerase-binding regulatory protein [Helicobacter sp. 13S00401-1]PAF49017.1 hypothetical protein BKH43_07435 [Helicobacter sp. 13S00401-1]